MRVSGIVLDVKKDTVTVMTPDGGFRRLPRRGQVAVGQKYSYSTGVGRGWVAAAAVLLAVLASVLLPALQQPAVAAYVSVDINPSLELGIAENLIVVSVDAANTEAAKLLEGLNLKGLPLQEALLAILEKAEKMNYFTPGSSAVVLAGTPAGKKEIDVSAVIAAAEDTVKKHAGKKTSSLDVAVVSGNREQREKARELGLSVGKYAVLLEAEDEGLDLKAEDLREKGIGRALLDIEAHPGTVLRNVNRKKTIPGKEQKDGGNKGRPAKNPPEPGNEETSKGKPAPKRPNGQ